MLLLKNVSVDLSNLNNVLKMMFIRIVFMIKKVKNKIFRIKKLMNIKVHELCVN